MLTEPIESRDECLDVVAVDAHGVPAEGLPLVRDGFDLQHARRGAVRL